MKGAGGAAKAAKSAGAQRAPQNARQAPAPSTSGGGNAFAALQKAAGNRAVNRLLSGGKPLDSGIRTAMEERLGADLSEVRIHSGARAAELADRMFAHAYTVGSDVVFGAGAYEPNSWSGRRLLAHELLHVVQQTARQGPRVSSSALEAEASAALSGAGRAVPAHVGVSAQVGVQRRGLDAEQLEAKLKLLEAAIEAKERQMYERGLDPTKDKNYQDLRDAYFRTQEQLKQPNIPPPAKQAHEAPNTQDVLASGPFRGMTKEEAMKKGLLLNMDPGALNDYLRNAPTIRAVPKSLQFPDFKPKPSPHMAAQVENFNAAWATLWPEQQEQRRKEQEQKRKEEEAAALKAQEEAGKKALVEQKIGALRVRPLGTPLPRTAQVVGQGVKAVADLAKQAANPETLAQATEIMLGFVPVVGQLMALYEVVAGKTLLTQRELSPVERGLIAATILAPMAGRILKAAPAAVRMINAGEGAVAAFGSIAARTGVRVPRVVDIAKGLGELAAQNGVMEVLQMANDGKPLGPEAGFAVMVVISALGGHIEKRVAARLAPGAPAAGAKAAKGKPGARPPAAKAPSPPPASQPEAAKWPSPPPASQPEAAKPPSPPPASQLEAAKPANVAPAKPPEVAGAANASSPAPPAAAAKPPEAVVSQPPPAAQAPAAAQLQPAGAGPAAPPTKQPSAPLSPAGTFSEREQMAAELDAHVAGGQPNTKPVVGQKLGAQPPKSPSGATPGVKAPNAVERRMQAEVDKEAIDRLADVPDLQKIASAEPQVLRMAAESPSQLRERFAEFNQKRASGAIKSARFSDYLKIRARADIGGLGEMSATFELGKNEIVIKPPKNTTEPGTDLVTYDAVADRVKLYDNKAVRKPVGKVSALEKNLRQNLSDDIADIKKWASDPATPPEVAAKALPKLEAALNDLDAYLKANPRIRMYSIRTQTAFQKILQKHGIDRIVTFDYGGKKAGGTRKLVRKGFQLQTPAAAAAPAPAAPAPVAAPAAPAPATTPLQPPSP